MVTIEEGSLQGLVYGGGNQSVPFNPGQERLQQVDALVGDDKAGERVDGEAFKSGLLDRIGALEPLLAPVEREGFG